MGQREPANGEIIDARRGAPPDARRRPTLTLAAMALPLLAVVLLYAWRPLKLGFYSDDWLVLLHPQAGSARAWSDLIAMYENRPASVLFAWLAQFAIDADPARAQVVDVALSVVAASALGWLAYRLAAPATAQHDARLWGAGVAAAAFLAFPWTLGFTAWATAAAAALPATILFCLAAGLLVGPGRDRWSRQLLACLLMGASFLQSFYGQFVIVLVLAAAMRPAGLDRTTLRAALLLGIVNVACIAYNRLAAGGNRKSFSENWQQTFLDGYFHYLWPNLLRSFREVAAVIVVCLVAAIGLGLVLLARSIGRLRAVLVCVTIMVGIFAGGLLYAIAGYGLITVGIFARVTVILNCYGALLLGLLAAAAAGRLDRERWPARAQIAACVVLLTAFGTATSYRLADWAGSWAVQTQVLRQLPHDARSFAGPDIAFLYVGPLGPADVRIANTPWEIPGAIAYAMLRDSPAAARQFMADIWSGRGRRWLADIPGWSTRFDGEMLSQRMCGNPVPTFTLAAKELWVWRVGEPRFAQASSGFHVDCEEPDKAD